MSTTNQSPYGGFIRFNPSQAFGDGEPMDTSHAHDFIFQNIEALNQGAVQTRIGTSVLTLPVADKTTITRGDDYADYKLAYTFSFPLTQLSDGTLAPLYVKITAGNVGTANQTVHYYVTLRRADVTPNWSGGESGKDFAATTHASTTPAVLTLGTDNVMYIPAVRARRPQVIATPLTNHATTRTGMVTEYPCCLDIWYRIPSASTLTDAGGIYAVYAREVAFRANP